MNIPFEIKAYIKYAITARHRKGFGIHSPYVFALINDVIRERIPYYSYAPLNQLRNNLLKDKTPLQIIYDGTHADKSTTIAHATKTRSHSAKYAQLLQRLCAHNKANTIFELGTNTGLTTLHLAANSSTSTVYTFEEQQTLIEIAQRNFNIIGADNIKIIPGNIENALQRTLGSINNIDIMYINTGHSYEQTMKYYNAAKTKVSSNSIFIIDTPHRSQEMQTAWEDIKTDRQATLTIDLFQIGLVFFKNNLPKQHYVVRY